MKKLHVIVQEKDIVSALESLRELGSIHVEHQEELSGYQLEERREEVGILKQALNILARFECKFDVHQQEARDWTDTVNEILELWAQIEHYQENIVQRAVQVRQWEPWGDFDPKDIEVLAARGIYLQFCEVPAKGKMDVPAGVILKEISSAAGTRRCVAISREKIDLPFTTIAPPVSGFGQMEKMQVEDQIKIRQAQEKIAELRCFFDSFQKILVERENVLRFEEVEKGMRAQEELALLKGYCPVDACGAIMVKAKQEQWGILLEDPSDEDSVPTLLRNPRWVEMIKPVFGIINVLPGYREVDISPVFLIFFSVFFGILIGDAAYGSIFLLLTLILHHKLKHKVKDAAPFILMYILGTSAVIWGVLTGTFLGTVLLGDKLKPVLGWLTESRNVQLFCFSIGATHLILAHLWRCVRRWPGSGAWAELGWVWILGVSFGLVRSMIVLGQADMAVILNALKMMVPGVALVIYDIARGPKGQIPVGIVLLLFSIISAFTDIISYVRLFAVGLAGVAVADAFNNMALSIGFNDVTSGIFASLILVVAHLFNIVLCGFGVLVHGLRLNVLEFSGHLGLEWAGFKYEPFRKLKQTSS
ncbi:MAG: hypothetical protein HZA28_05690 [Candidatus Omnitrophica bacterium]|nr:hypothetical protein [Candidatus Omnitrophota bacterium]